MKTIVFLVTQLINSGPENVVYNICNNLDRSVYLPIVFSLKSEDPLKSIENRFREIGVNIIHFDASTMELELLPRRFSKKIQKGLLDVNCDILHVHCYHPNIVGVFIRGIKKITTVHQISGEDFIMKKGVIIGSYMKFRFDNTLKHYDRIAVLSDYMKEYYKQCNGNIVKIPNGVTNCITGTNIELFRNSISATRSIPVILVTGTLSDRKNVVFLLTELKKSKQLFNCYILGKGDKYNECLRIIDGDQRFHLEGFKDNVWDYLGISDIYISASKSEGLPMSVLEALSAGIPCLLSNIPPHREIAREAKVKGVELFDIKKGALQEAFDMMLLSKYNHEIIKSSSQKLYSSKRMTTLYENVYISCLES